MSPAAPGTTERLRALIEICTLEAQYLQRSDKRLFASPPTQQTIEALAENDDIAERIDAFVARFGRLQDTIGDKLLPAFLQLMQEYPGTMLDNLDRAERLGLIDSADDWAAIRKLRDRMIHEYVKDPAELLDSLTAAHQYIPALLSAMQAIIQAISKHFPDIAS